MKITKIIGEVIFNIEEEIERIKTEIKLMWIPGVKPVIVPAIIPSKMAIVISIIIKLIVRIFI